MENEIRDNMGNRRLKEITEQAYDALRRAVTRSYSMSSEEYIASIHLAAAKLQGLAGRCRNSFVARMLRLVVRKLEDAQYAYGRGDIEWMFNSAYGAYEIMVELIHEYDIPSDSIASLADPLVDFDA